MFCDIILQSSAHQGCLEALDLFAIKDIVIKGAYKKDEKTNKKDNLGMHLLSVNDICLVSSSWQLHSLLGRGGQYLSSIIGRQQSPPSKLQFSLLKLGVQI